MARESGNGGLARDLCDLGQVTSPPWFLFPHLYNKGLRLGGPMGPAAGIQYLLREGASLKNPRQCAGWQGSGRHIVPPIFTKDCPAESLGARQRRVSPHNSIKGGGILLSALSTPAMPPGICDQESPLGPNLSRFRERPVPSSPSSPENLTLTSKSYPIPILLFESPARRPIW